VSVVGGAPDRPRPPAPEPAPEPAPLPEYVVPFGEGMTLPSGLRGCEPNYTPQAMAARVEGLAIVECIIRADGTNTSCEIVKGLPYMDEALLSAMNGCRSTPITFQGEPVDNVVYTWRIWLKPPR
jgi:protein TonB